MSEYPEHDKLQKVQADSRAIGQFLEWLRGDRGLVLADYHQHSEGCGHIPHDSVNYPAECGYMDDQLETLHIGIEELLAEYYEINLAEIEQEKAQNARIITGRA